MKKNEIINILASEVQSAAKQRYGDELPQLISSRIRQELHLAEHFHLAGQMLAFYFLSRHMKSYHIPYWIRGATSCSFLLYLLSVTYANPLPPHYFCAHCKSFLADNSRQDGYDLPPRTCVCGQKMERDGHNLALEQFWGGDVCNLRSSQQSMNMDVPETAFDLACDFLRSQPLLRGIQENRPSHGKTAHFGKIVIQRNDDLPEHSVSWFQPISAASVLSFVTNHFATLLPEVSASPQTFSEALRAYGLEHGTWLNECVAVKPDRLSDNIPVFYDDLYDLLLEKFLPKDAWREAELLHFGKEISPAASEMLTPVQAEWCHQATYLFPRAHAVEYILMHFRQHRADASC